MFCHQDSSVLVFRSLPFLKRLLENIWTFWECRYGVLLDISSGYRGFHPFGGTLVIPGGQAILHFHDYIRECRYGIRGREVLAARGQAFVALC